MREPIDLEALFPDRASGEPLGSQLVRRLRRAIESGFFPPATRLLPSRELATRLGIARNTVTSAFDQLVAEGYLESRVGDGTYVTETFRPARGRTPVAVRPLAARARAIAVLKRDLDALGTSEGPLRIGAPDLREFPVRTWQRLSRKHVAGAAEHLDYGRSSGVGALRAAISRHIAQYRGVVADPEQITIVEGAQAALHLIALVLAEPGDTVAIEDPCYGLARAAFTARGLRLHGVRVDDDGMRTSELPAAATCAYVTPSHQFPLGGALPLARRIELLGWARHGNAYIIEDDYDSEFDARPLPALQSLDRTERVIYVGTFSKTLAPGLRLGYVVAPPHLADLFRFARAVASLGASAQQQATLADFIAQGHFSRHIRRMAAIYQRRRNILVNALSDGLPPGFRIGPAQTGLHVAVTAPSGFDDVAAANALPRGHRALPISLLCVSRTDCRGLACGFSSAPDDALRRAAAALVATLQRRAEG
jgi:GntR family transcriptional regulator/MocR family aminotransferase